MGPETGFGFLRKEIDDFCGIAMATSIGLEVEDRGLGMVEAKRLEQAMGEVNHKEGETSGIGDRGRLDGHKVFESPELFSIAEIKFKALIIVSATQAEWPASSVRCHPCGTGL